MSTFKLTKKAAKQIGTALSATVAGLTDAEDKVRLQARDNAWEIAIGNGLDCVAVVAKADDKPAAAKAFNAAIDSVVGAMEFPNAGRKSEFKTLLQIAGIGKTIGDNVGTLQSRASNIGRVTTYQGSLALGRRLRDAHYDTAAPVVKESITKITEDMAARKAARDKETVAAPCFLKLYRALSACAHDRKWLVGDKPMNKWHVVDEVLVIMDQYGTALSKKDAAALREATKTRDSDKPKAKAPAKPKSTVAAKAAQTRANKAAAQAAAAKTADIEKEADDLIDEDDLLAVVKANNLLIAQISAKLKGK